MSDTGLVNIHGKQYQTVAKRISDFRASYPSYPIETEIITNADIVIVKATIKDDKGVVIATGYAEEVRGSTNINKTSALENCETSAVGRALAFFGLGGTEIASANEVSNAVIQQAKQEVGEYFVSYNSAVRKHYGEIMDYKMAIASDDLESAVGLWYDLPQEAQNILYKLAPTKGGILETKERDIMKTNEWKAARDEYYKNSQGELNEQLR